MTGEPTQRDRFGAELALLVVLVGICVVALAVTARVETLIQQRDAALQQASDAAARCP